MRYSKFKTESGIDFFYDNVDNKLFETTGEEITVFKQDPAIWDSYRVAASENYGSRQKHNKPVALRILMGHACNYSCTYCMQKDIGNPDELPRRKTLDTFFDQVRENLDLSNLMRVELWGGEPFLYWNDMMELMRFFDNERIEFTISTNGSALSPKHAEFFSTLKCNKVYMGISHDAYMQQQLRGDEIFDRPRVIQTLKMIDELPNVMYSFTCSITNTNFDLFAINEFFRNKILEHDLYANSISFSLGRTYQESLNYNPSNSLGCNSLGDVSDYTNKPPGSESFTHVIHGDNLIKFRQILGDFLEAHYKQYIDSFVDGQPTIFGRYAKDLPLLACDIMEETVAYSAIEYARKLISGEPILEDTNCGADMKDILSLDLDGMIRTCPHAGSEHITGTINNIKGIRITAIDMTRKSTHCSGCANKKLCRSSCPIKFPDEVFLTNCRVEKIWYGEIQKAAFRILFNSNVEMIASGLDAIGD
jgi:radical SAM protein with 4Fe4S-binding SPASM domain